MLEPVGDPRDAVAGADQLAVDGRGVAGGDRCAPATAALHRADLGRRGVRRALAVTVALGDAAAQPVQLAAIEPTARRRLRGTSTVIAPPPSVKPPVSSETTVRRSATRHRRPTPPSAAAGRPGRPRLPRRASSIRSRSRARDRRLEAEEQRVAAEPGGSPHGRAGRALASRILTPCARCRRWPAASADHQLLGRLEDHRVARPACAARRPRCPAGTDGAVAGPVEQEAHRAAGACGRAGLDADQLEQRRTAAARGSG